MQVWLSKKISMLNFGRRTIPILLEIDYFFITKMTRNVVNDNDIKQYNHGGEEGGGRAERSFI